MRLKPCYKTRISFLRQNCTKYRERIPEKSKMISIENYIVPMACLTNVAIIECTCILFDFASINFSMC